MRSLDKSTLDKKNFIGKVIDNDDPEREGRCRVEVFGIFTGLSSEEIPWANPGYRRMFAGSDGGFADISVPKIGTFVQVRFVEGDIYNMEYVAIQNINPAVQEEIADSYLNSHVLAYDTDEELKIFYTPAKGVEIYLKRSHITINPDSSITIEHADSQSIIELVGTEINIVSEQSVNVTSTNCIIEAGNIELGEGAVEAVIKGNTFQTLFNKHTHLTAVPGAPTSPPVIPLVGSELSTITKTL